MYILVYLPATIRFGVCHTSIILLSWLIEKKRIPSIYTRQRLFSRLIKTITSDTFFININFNYNTYVCRCSAIKAWAARVRYISLYLQIVDNKAKYTHSRGVKDFAASLLVKILFFSLFIEEVYILWRIDIPVTLGMSPRVMDFSQTLKQCILYTN